MCICCRAVTKNKTDEKYWICLGNFFIKLPKDKTKKILDQSELNSAFLLFSTDARILMYHCVVTCTDYEQLDSEIDRLRRGLKIKVDNLRHLEGDTKSTRAFDLQPLTKEDLESVEGLL